MQRNTTWSANGARHGSTATNYSDNVADSPVLTPILQVAPSNATIDFGGTQQFFATAVFADGSKEDVSPNVAWLSTVPTVATIDNSGLASGVSGGSTGILASYGQGVYSVVGGTNLHVGALGNYTAMYTGTVTQCCPGLSCQDVTASGGFGFTVDNVGVLSVYGNPFIPGYVTNQSLV